MSRRGDAERTGLAGGAPARSLPAVSAALIAVALASITACGSVASLTNPVGSPSSQQPNAQAANAYLATGSNWVNYLQWSNQGVGSLTDDTLSGTAPDEQVSSSQTPLTVSVNGSEVTFSGLTPDTGTLANGTLTLQVLDPDGTLGTDTFTPATQDQFNQAVAVLQNQAASDNSGAVQASASASQASASAAAGQQAQAGLAAVQGISFTSDLSSLAGDVTQANTDLGTVKSDAANGQGTSCSNADTVESDLDTVTSDADTVTSDLDGLTSDISSARQAISALQGDVSVPGAPAAITTAQGTISSAISTANGDIGQTNGDVAAAAQVLGSLATGSCSNIGIPYSPSPIPAIS